MISSGVSQFTPVSSNVIVPCPSNWHVTAPFSSAPGSLMLYGVVVCRIKEHLECYPASGDARARNGLLFYCAVTSSIAMITQLMNVYYASANRYTAPRDVTTTDAFDPQPTVSFWGNTGAIQRKYWPVPANPSRLQFVQILWISVFLALSAVLGLVSAIMIAVDLTTAAAISSASRTETVFSSTELICVWHLERQGSHRCYALGHWFSDCRYLDRRRTYLEIDHDKDVLQKNQLIGALSCATLGDPSDPPCENWLIKRLVVGAVQTGSTTSFYTARYELAAVATMVSYYILDEGTNDSNIPTHSIPGPGGTVSMAIYYLIGPLYMLTLLYNLNLRQYRDRIDTNVSESTDIRFWVGCFGHGRHPFPPHRNRLDRPARRDASRTRVDVTVTKLSPDTEGGLSAPKGGRAGRVDL
ncbi:hypothetical protein B0H14DRAFT_3458530 [Mycena olivaceomarginata]|nr:hypothetical protein B0H14DRAFT_3458530 [Mycena olivaceomarginata]